MSIILSFIPIFYLKQQSNVLQCFCSLKFEKRLFSDKFLSFIFCSSYSWKEPNKIFCSKLAGKITFFYTKTAAWLYFCCQKLRIFKPAESCKVLFHHLANHTGSWNALNYDVVTSNWTHHLNIRKRKP